MSTRKILVLEDNPADFQLTKLALIDAGVSENICHFESGETFARDLIKFAATDVAFILLDLNMPGINGFEILEHMQSGRIINLNIPVIVFTTSNNDVHKERCIELGAAAYMVKPIDINDYFDTIKRITKRWYHTDFSLVN